MLKYQNNVGYGREKLGNGACRPHQLLPPLGLEINCPPRAGRRGWSGPKHQTAPNKTPPSPKGQALKLICEFLFEPGRLSRSLSNSHSHKPISILGQAFLLSGTLDHKARQGFTGGKVSAT